MLRAIAVHLRGLLRRGATNAELDEEMRYHLERDAASRMARGMPAKDAHAAARRAFGNVTVLTEQARDAGRIEWLEQLAQDVRYAVRGFLRAPRFALTRRSARASRIGGSSRGEPMMLQLVTGDFFRMLGVPAALGRMLEPDDTRRVSGSPVLVLSHRAWRTKFGGDSSVIGRRLLVRGQPFEVVGVAQPGFDGLSDMSAASAERALGAWASVTADRPERERAASIVLESRATATHMSPEAMAETSPIFIAFVLVLLIACANVANMMLARGLARQREIGIRLALGAARGRLVRQLLTEAFVLAVPASAAGYAISRLGISAGVNIMFASVPPVFAPYLRVLPLSPDGRLFAFLAAAAVISAVAFGLIPALQATRASVIRATRGDFEGPLRPARLRGLLVVGQITVCALLLVCAGVLLRGARRLELTDPRVPNFRHRASDAAEGRAIERHRSSSEGAGSFRDRGVVAPAVRPAPAPGRRARRLVGGNRQRRGRPCVARLLRGVGYPNREGSHLHSRRGESPPAGGDRE